MEEYRSNSHKLRDGAVEPVVKEKAITPAIPEGSARIQKQNGFTKFMGDMIADDIRSIGASIYGDILIPSFKKILDEIASNAIHMLLYGKAAEPKTSSFASKISYGGFYKQPVIGEPLKANTGPNVLNFDNVIFRTRGEAEVALATMEDILDSGYKAVTICDFYEIAHLADYVPDWTYNKYGWYTVEGIQVRKCIGQDGYYIPLPPARLIN